MEIEKEQNIIVRYIPQYIVIETRYKSVLPKEEQNISKTTSNAKYNCDAEIVQHDVENSLQDINFDQWDDYTEYNEDSEFSEIKHIESKTVDITDSKLNSPKRKYDSKTSKLLNDWFLSHLHVRY